MEWYKKGTQLGSWLKKEESFPLLRDCCKVKSKIYWLLFTQYSKTVQFNFNKTNNSDTWVWYFSFFKTISQHTSIQNELNLTYTLSKRAQAESTVIIEAKWLIYKKP